MAEISIIIIIVIFSIIAIIVGIFEFIVFKKNKKTSEDLHKREESAKGKMYEISILNELSVKIGYSLTVQNVIEIIIGSLRDLLDYNAVSYMLLLPEKIVFRNYVEKPISKKFIDEVKVKMIDSLSVILNTNFKNTKIEEKTWGTVLDEESSESLGSFFI